VVKNMNIISCNRI